MQERAWGFGSVDLDCPICHWPLQIEDWYPWVGEAVIKLFEESKSRVNKMGRFCKSCGHKQLFYNEEELLEDCEELLKNIGIDYASGPRSNILKWQEMNKSNLSEVEVNLIAKTLVQDFVDFFREDYEEDYAGEAVALRKLLRFELKYTCDSCTKLICMRCGENDWHFGKSCIDQLQTLTDDADVQWKLQNWYNLM